MPTTTKTANATQQIWTVTGVSDLSNSSSTTNLVNETIPANALGPNSRMVLECDFTLTSSATPPSFTLTISFGTMGTVSLLSSVGITANLTNAPFTLKAVFSNQNAKNVQTVITELTQGQSIFTGVNLVSVVSSAATEPTDSDVALLVQCRFAGADASTVLKTTNVRITM